MTFLKYLKKKDLRTRVFIKEDKGFNLTVEKYDCEMQ